MELDEANAVDEYIARFPEGVRALLTQLRDVIRGAAPEAEEVISYAMPAYKLHTILVYFAGYEGHIGFYPCPAGIEAFKHEFTAYKWAKGSVQFPVSEPLPVDLITRIVRFRADQETEKARMKRARPAKRTQSAS